VCQQIRFTPPRDLSPPPAHPAASDEFKSEQRITLASSSGAVYPIALGRPRSTAQPQTPTTRPPRRRRPPQQAPANADAAVAAASQWVAPSPEEAARARAQIGSEVLQWHARRSSRSFSVEETSSATTSEPQSPTGSIADPALVMDGWPALNADHQASSAQQQTMTSSTVLVFK